MGLHSSIERAKEPNDRRIHTRRVSPRRGRFNSWWQYARAAPGPGIIIIIIKERGGYFKLIIRCKVEALHPIPIDLFGDGTTFPAYKLQNYGYTLSNKPLSVNHAGMPFAKFILHAESRSLEYPQNRCLEFRYNAKTDTLGGEIEVSDAKAIEMIKDGRIKHVSVEHRSYSDGGMSFDKLSLLTNDLQPRDPQARIISFVTVMEEDNNNLTYDQMVEAVREHYRPVKGVPAEKLRALGPKFVRLTYEHMVCSRAAEKLEGYEEGRLKALFYATLYEKLAYEEFKQQHQHEHRIICNTCGKPKRESPPVREWGAPMPATFERVID